MSDAATLATALAAGISMGLTFCTVSCLPFMGSWALGRAGGGKVGLRDAWLFIAGRIAGYAALGGASGLLGQAVTAALGSGPGHLLIGLGALVSGLLLLAPASSPGCSARMMHGWPPLAMGAAFAMVPCTPLATLMAAAAASGGGGNGAALGLAFGLGTGVTPLLAVLPALGMIGFNLKSQQPWIGRWLRLGCGLSLLATAGREFYVGMT